MFVKDLMWSNPEVIHPFTTLKDAAAKMKEVDSGVLAVGLEGKIEGIITDRDIVIRAVSQGKNPANEKVADHMTRRVLTCSEADSIGTAAEVMKKNKVGRLAVLGQDGRISGIVSFGHILRNEANPEELADVVTRVATRNGGQQRQKKAVTG